MLTKIVVKCNLYTIYIFLADTLRSLNFTFDSTRT